MVKRVTYEPYGDDIRLMLAKQGLDLQTFARMTGYSGGWISLIVRNKRTVSARAAKTISMALNVPIERLFKIEVIDC